MKQLEPLVNENTLQFKKNFNNFTFSLKANQKFE